MNPSPRPSPRPTGRGRRSADKINQRSAKDKGLAGPACATLGHARARRFENAPLPLPQAMNAMRGDLVQNGIDFPADEFRGAQLGIIRELVLLPEGALGIGRWRETALASARQSKPGPVE